VVSALPHVLIAEDNDLASDALRVLFEATGHRVSVAGEVNNIVAIAGADPVDLLLLDAGLEGGDCFDVLSGLRAQRNKPRVIAALTGRDEPEFRQRCRDEGCVAVLLKPVSPRDLLRMASEWLAAPTAAT
jgi:DNA-binding response OmpR family regulator